MRLLKTECEPGRDPPRGAGSKSLVNLVAEDRLRETVSSGVEGSRAFSTQSGHLHLAASSVNISAHYSERILIRDVEHTVVGFERIDISGTLAMCCKSLG